MSPREGPVGDVTPIISASCGPAQRPVGERGGEAELLTPSLLLGGIFQVREVRGGGREDEGSTSESGNGSGSGSGSEGES